MLAFLGRRAVPGMVPDMALEACGTPGSHAGRIKILNPLYEFVSVPRSDS